MAVDAAVYEVVQKQTVPMAVDAAGYGAGRAEEKDKDTNKKNEIWIEKYKYIIISKLERHAYINSNKKKDK
jgi:hypothetical protein